jgi:hypothetical protein
MASRRRGHAARPTRGGVAVTFGSDLPAREICVKLFFFSSKNHEKHIYVYTLTSYLNSSQSGPITLAINIEIQNKLDSVVVRVPSGYTSEFHVLI